MCINLLEMDSIFLSFCFNMYYIDIDVMCVHSVCSKSNATFEIYFTIECSHELCSKLSAQNVYRIEVEVVSHICYSVIHDGRTSLRHESMILSVFWSIFGAQNSTYA